MKTKIILLASVVLLSLAPVAAQAGFYRDGEFGLFGSARFFCGQEIPVFDHRRGGIAVIELRAVAGSPGRAGVAFELASNSSSPRSLPDLAMAANQPVVMTVKRY